MTGNYRSDISTGGKGGSASTGGDVDPADENNYGMIEFNSI